MRALAENLADADPVSRAFRSTIVDRARVPA
jgi:hypothetical protein